MRNYLTTVGLSFALFVLPVTAFSTGATGPSGAPVVAASPAPAAVAAPGMLDTIVETGKAIGKAMQDWHMSGWQTGLMAILMIVLGLMKNSALRPLWDKWNWYPKAFIAPGLALVVAMLASLKMGFSWNGVIVAVTTGVGAIAMHELMDGLKQVPVVGAKYGTLIDWLGKLLKKPEPPKVA